MTQAEIEEILARIKGHEQVQGYIITNQKGEIIRNQFNDPAQREEGNRIASYIPELVYKTKVTCKNIGSKEDKTENNLQFMRIKTAKYELLIAPDNEFILIVIQSNSKSSEKAAEE